MSRSRKKIAFAGIAVASSLFGDMALYTVLPVYYGALGLTPIQVGLILSVNRWIRLFTNTAAERLLSRYSKALLFPVSLGTAALLTLTYGFQSPFLFFLATRAAWGFCWSILRHAGTMKAVESADDDKIGRYLGFYNSLVRIGFLLANSLSGLFFDAVGFRGTFLVMAALTATGMPFALMTFSGRDRDEGGVAVKEERPRGPGLELQGFIVGVVGSGMIMSTLGKVLSSSAEGGVLSIGSAVIGVATVNGILLATRHALGIAGSPLLGAFIDKIGIQRSVLLCMIGAGAALSGGTFVRSPFALVLLVICFFLCETALSIGLAAQAGRSGPRRYARYVSAADLGSAGGPLIGWSMIQLSIGSELIFLVGAVLYLAGATVFGINKHRSGRLDPRNRDLL